MEIAPNNDATPNPTVSDPAVATLSLPDRVLAVRIGTLVAERRAGIPTTPSHITNSKGRLLEANEQLNRKVDQLTSEPNRHAVNVHLRLAAATKKFRNIHPVHNEGRRKARAEAILGKIDSSSTALFFDAAKYWKKDAYVVKVVNAKASLVNAATVVTGFTHEAEELAIAVALQERRRDVTIFSDSRTVIRSFSSGFVSAAAASIVNKTTAEANEGEDPLTHIIWFPAHMGDISSSPTGNPNERAHQLAREL
ncbi:hypothetical protein HPB52_018946 [Rhipicephalus sanguineus]|uniref:Tick transposon n=1 Tax=Rhipicephalus sanguineus TaxID=34632 RepID=A0A9D4Q2R5_RHISA|nr:hypothetical protein HPB52_018946 [Rhipicephalus sanguineus]